MDEMEYTRVMKRVGTVLIVVGLLGIGVMAYCIAKNISYSSSLSIFAVVAGIFLIKGSLRAAGIILWFGAFFLTTFVCTLVVVPFVFPTGLMLAELRLYPMRSLMSLAYVVFMLVLIWWVTQQLRKRPALPARTLFGMIRSVRGAQVSGVLIVLALVLVLGLSLNGKDARHAKEIAAAEIGPGYEYQVTSIDWSSGSNGAYVSAVVTAWNDHEIRHVPVHWKEP